MPASSPPADRKTRAARRKQATHDRLVAAAFKLIAERGVDGVAINEITEAADVGFGSFYNHFPSKDAIYSKVFEIVVEEFGAVLDSLTAKTEDPAEVVAVCVRHTILRAQAEPLWGRFLLRESLTPHGLTKGLGARLLRDIQVGLDQGRFRATAAMTLMMMAGGTIMACLAVQAGQQTGVSVPAELKVDVKQLAERTAEAVLWSLGVPEAEAAALVRKPLPRLAKVSRSLLSGPAEQSS